MVVTFADYLSTGRDQHANVNEAERGEPCVGNHGVAMVNVATVAIAMAHAEARFHKGAERFLGGTDESLTLCLSIILQPFVFYRGG